MDFKKEIEKLLFSLKEIGIDRRTIEKDLGYVPKSIDQILSKGGNEKALGNIKRYYIEKSNTGIKEVKPDVVTPKSSEMKDLIQTNKDLAAANLELTLLLKGVKNNSDSQQRIDVILEPYLHQLASGMVGKSLSNESDVMKEFRRILIGALTGGIKSGKHS